MTRILLADDDPAIRRALRLGLGTLGHTVVEAEDGPSCLVLLAADPGIDVLVLDIMMPRLDGFAVCRQVRATSPLPIIMLTARSRPADVINGLEAGADDYVIKPIDARVLDARIRALLRRIPNTQALSVGGLEIDEAGATVRRDGVDLGLTATEFRLLLALAHNAGHVLSRNQLLSQVWDYGYDGDSRLVDATIQRVRAKIEKVPAHPQIIATVRGFGYRMER